MRLYWSSFHFTFQAIRNQRVMGIGGPAPRSSLATPPVPQLAQDVGSQLRPGV